jgi:Kef-type K+ transport system membrane component KefB
MRLGTRQPDADVLRSLDQTGSLLLPVFFVVTGLSLNFGAMNPTALILLAVIFTFAATGKIGPAYAASRLSGLGRGDSAVIATLVNTRGLTELIALNVGLADHIIVPRLFTILVLMAVATTLMTGPLLSWIRPRTADLDQLGRVEAIKRK